MIEKIKHQDFLWLNIKKPTKKDLEYLSTNFNFHPIVIKELKKPSIRSHVDHFEDYLYFVYHIPIYDPEIRSSVPKEIDFIVTKNCLITATYEEIDIFEEFFKKCKEDLRLQELYLREGPGRIIVEIIKIAIQFALRELTHIAKKLRMAEREIFSERLDEERKVKEISFIKRDILNFQLITRPHQKLLHSLFLEGSKFFGRKYKIYFSTIEAEEVKVSDTIQNYRDMIESLEKTNSNLIEIKINRIMKVITVLAFITFPLTFLSSLFGMNVKYAPFLGKPYDFWIISLSMLFLAFLMFAYFKKKKWI
ncbi:MAG: magnesium transporter CorA family protein [Candidatus Pacebacteria bacterium]|nr:magnesium transporter CorA family protein [Candidatus Paceibacterota bacterium]